MHHPSLPTSVPSFPHNHTHQLTNKLDQPIPRSFKSLFGLSTPLAGLWLPCLLEHRFSSLLSDTDTDGSSWPSRPQHPQNQPERWIYPDSQQGVAEPGGLDCSNPGRCSFWPAHRGPHPCRQLDQTALAAARTWPTPLGPSRTSTAFSWPPLSGTWLESTPAPARARQPTRYKPAQRKAFDLTQSVTEVLRTPILWSFNKSNVNKSVELIPPTYTHPSRQPVTRSSLPWPPPQSNLAVRCRRTRYPLPRGGPAGRAPPQAGAGTAAAGSRRRPSRLTSGTAARSAG